MKTSLRDARPTPAPPSRWRPCAPRCRARLLGRADDAMEHYVSSAVLNVRVGPGTEFITLPGSPLPAGTRVAVLEQQGLWWRVDVLDTVNDVMDLVGWCHSRFLTKA